MPRASGSTRLFRGKYFFLTYSAVGIPATISDPAAPATVDNDRRAAAFVEEWNAGVVRWGCTKWVLGQEPHQDGAWHFHAVVYKEKGWDITSARYFDVAGTHPNVSKPKSAEERKNKIRYCTKGYCLGESSPT